LASAERALDMDAEKRNIKELEKQKGELTRSMKQLE
jgi:hypothetical protein